MSVFAEFDAKFAGPTNAFAYTKDTEPKRMKLDAKAANRFIIHAIKQTQEIAKDIAKKKKNQKNVENTAKVMVRRSLRIMMKESPFSFVKDQTEVEFIQAHSNTMDKAKKISKKKRQEAINKRRSLPSPTKTEPNADGAAADPKPSKGPVPLTLHIALPFFSSSLNEFNFNKK